jgi:hypothetical protein
MARPDRFLRCIYIAFGGVIQWALRRGEVGVRLPPAQGEGPNDSWLRKISPTHKRINAKCMGGARSCLLRKMRLCVYAFMRL